jgi:DNA-binding CsgD family transcriptional regulator
MKVAKEPIEQRIIRKISQINEVADDIPGIVIIININTFGVEYMSPSGLQLLNIDLADLKKMGSSYHETYFNVQESEKYVPRILGLLERNNSNEVISFFQQVRYCVDSPWNWYCTSVKILLRDDDGLPLLTMSVAIPIDAGHDLGIKATKAINEHKFLHIHREKFDTLSDREKTILRFLALGKSSTEIAEELHISPFTVDTHRKKIKQKLGAINVYDLSQYARAFDLV